MRAIQRFASCASKQLQAIPPSTASRLQIVQFEGLGSASNRSCAHLEAKRGLTHASNHKVLRKQRYQLLRKLSLPAHHRANLQRAVELDASCQATWPSTEDLRTPAPSQSSTDEDDDAEDRTAGVTLEHFVENLREALQSALNVNRIPQSLAAASKAVRLYRDERQRLLTLFNQPEQQRRRAKMKPRARDKHSASLMHAANYNSQRAEVELRFAQYEEESDDINARDETAALVLEDGIRAARLSLPGCTWAEWVAHSLALRELENRTAVLRHCIAESVKRRAEWRSQWQSLTTPHQGSRAGVRMPPMQP